LDEIFHFLHEVAEAIKDWQTIVAGILALVAAWMSVRGAINAADRQIKALRSQNHELRAMARREQAERRLTVATMLDFTLKALGKTISAQPISDGMGSAESISYGLIRGTFVKPAGFDEMWEHVMVLGPFISRQYLQVRAILERYRTAKDEDQIRGSSAREDYAHIIVLIRGLEQELLRVINESSKIMETNPVSEEKG
jgi:hypothetical protein